MGTQSTGLGAILTMLVCLGAAPRPQQELPYFTQLGDKILSRSSLVVLGEVEAVSRALRGGEVVTVQVTETRLGEEHKSVTILAERGSFFAGSEMLLFLTPNEGPTFSCLNRISRSDPDFDAKMAVLVQNLEIRELTDEESRKAHVRQILYENARSTDTWTNWNVARELQYVLQKYPDLLRAEDVKALLEVAEATSDEEFGKELRRLLRDKVGE